MIVPIYKIPVKNTGPIIQFKYAGFIISTPPDTTHCRVRMVLFENSVLRPISGIQKYQLPILYRNSLVRISRLLSTIAGVAQISPSSLFSARISS